MAKKQKTGSWIVRMKCTVIKDVVCDGCTEEQAESNPYDYSIEENEIEQTDYEVLSVKPND